MRRLSLLLFLLVCGGSCSLPFHFDSTAKSYYMLTARRSAQKHYLSHPLQILVQEMLASGFVESHRIVFTKGDGQRGFYQFTSWSEVPSKQIADILLDRIRDSNMFFSASRAGSGAVADLQLNTELNEFVHDISSEDGVVRVRISAELIDLRTRRVLGSAQFGDERKVSENDAEGAVQSFSESVSVLADQIVEWLNQTLSAPQGDAPETPAAQEG